ncbi:MAG: hypothetical protein AAF567_02270 [Actinomycetota bacterium]
MFDWFTRSRNGSLFLLALLLALVAAFVAPRFWLVADDGWLVLAAWLVPVPALYLVAVGFGVRSFRVAMAIGLLGLAAHLAAVGQLPPITKFNSERAGAEAANKAIPAAEDSPPAPDDTDMANLVLEQRLDRDGSIVTSTATFHEQEPGQAEEASATVAAQPGISDHIDAGLEEHLHRLPTGVFANVRLGTVGWLIVAVLVALGWRGLENVNARRTRAPVVVEKFIVPESFKDADRLTSQFENGLAYAGILEPASVPGGQVADELLEVFGTDNTATSWFTPVLRLFKIATPKRGTIVVPTLETASPPRVSVRVVTARQRRTLYTRAFSLPTLDATVERAAAYVGQLTHSESVTTPQWARWRPDGGEAFDLFLDVTADGGRVPPGELDFLEAFDDLHKPATPDPAAGSPRDDESPESVSGATAKVGAEVETKATLKTTRKINTFDDLPIEKDRTRKMRALRVALRSNPINGVARVELGHEYELRGREGDRWKALRLHLEAAYDHPRMFMAHYRVATTLSLLAGDGGPAFASASPQDLQSIASLLRYVFPRKRFGPYSAAALAEKIDRNDPRAGDQGDLERVLLALSKHSLNRSAHLLRRRALLLHAIVRPSERQYRLDLLRDRDRRFDLMNQIGVVRCIVDLRCTPTSEIQRELDVDTHPGRPFVGRSGALIWFQRRTGSGSPSVEKLKDSVHSRADRSGRRLSPGAGTYYTTACFYGVLARRLANDAPDPYAHRDDVIEAKREARMEQLKSTAVGFLNRSRRAVGGGFPSAQWLLRDPDLAVLQPSADRDPADPGDPAFMEVVEWARAREHGLTSLRALQTDQADSPKAFKPSAKSIADWELMQRGKAYAAYAHAFGPEVIDDTDAARAAGATEPTGVST